MLQVNTTDYSTSAAATQPIQTVVPTVLPPQPSVVNRSGYVPSERTTITRKYSVWNNIVKFYHDHTVPCLLGAIAVLLMIPVGTTVIKEDRPDMQWRIKLAVSLITFGLSSGGLYNEYRAATIKARKFRDADTNRSYQVQRDQWMDVVEHEDLNREAQAQRQLYLSAISHGKFGMPFANPAYLPQSLGGQTSELGAAPVSAAMPLSTAVSGDMSGFEMPPAPPPGASPNGMTVEEAYRYMHDKTKINNPNVLWFGDSGDCKTSAMHNALHSWLMDDALMIPYICDRKLFGEDNPMWRSNWTGLPVYKDIEALTANGHPSPSIYTNATPDLKRWLKPVYELVKFRMQSKKTADPFYDKANDRRRTVLIVIDDATTIIEELENPADKAEIIRMLNSITTNGRSTNVHIWFCAHSNTSNAIGLSTTAITMMNPVMGASFCDNSSALQWTKKPFCQEGIDAARADQTRKARGFATAWPECPYIPAAPLPNGLLGLVIPELCCIWHQHAPDGFILDEDMIWHTKSFEVCKFDINNRKTSTITPTPAALGVAEEVSEEDVKPASPSPDSSIPVTATEVVPSTEGFPPLPVDHTVGTDSDPWDNLEVTSRDIEILMTLRDWYKEAMKNFRSKKGPEPTLEVVKDSYAQLRNKKPTDDEIEREVGTVFMLIKLNDAKFHEHLYGDPDDLNDDLID